MRKIIVFMVVILCISFVTSAQNCGFYFPEIEGAEVAYTSFNKKGKVFSSSKTRIKSVTSSDGAMSAIVETQTFNKKGKDQGKMEFEMKCKDGVFSYDMKKFIAPETLSAYENTEFTVKSEDLKFPVKLSVGDKLDDAKVELTLNIEGMPAGGMSVYITDRKVVGQEKITTTAGTFDCYKITYKTEMKTVFSIITEGTEWIALGVGNVKTETFRKGKSMGYTLLTGIKK